MALRTIERTLIIFKPDAVLRGIVGDIMARFERVGFKIVGIKMIRPEREHYHAHYEDIGTLKTRKGQEIFDRQVEGMLEGPVIAMVLEGVEAVEVARKLVGDTQPKTSPPGTIRGDYAHLSFDHATEASKTITNIVHASADKKEAQAEIKHWFKPAELFDYRATHEVFTQPHNR